jgi:Uncharacterized alpha/beta hydrolase domain (DUF2235)
MSKNIIICCDGTGNKLDVCKSNVVRLFSILRRDDPASQVALYDPGVGTMAPAAALTSVSRLATKLAGGAVLPREAPGERRDLAADVGLGSVRAKSFRSTLRSVKPSMQVHQVGRQFRIEFL